MKKTHLRLTALLLVLVMVLTAGCGGGKATTLSGAIENTLAIDKATFEGEISFKDIPQMSGSPITGIAFSGAIDRGDYDFSLEFSLKKDKNATTEESYGMEAAVLQALLSAKGSLVNVTKTGGFLYIDFSPIIKIYGDNLQDVIFGLLFSSEGRDDYEDAKEACADAKLDDLDTLIALYMYGTNSYYDDMEEVIDDMDEYADDVDEIRATIEDIEKAAGITVPELLKATGVKVELGALSKDAKAAIAKFENALVGMVKAAEEADKEFVTVDKKAGSYEWELSDDNVEDIMEPVFDYLLDQVDDLWDAWGTIADWGVHESVLPGNVKKVLEKVDEYLDYGIADDFDDQLEDAYDAMTDKGVKKDIESALEDAQDGLGDFADNMKDRKATISGTYTLTGGKGKRVATCEIEMKTKEEGSASIEFTLTEGSAKIEAPGNALDVMAIIDKADIEAIMEIIEDLR